MSKEGEKRPTAEQELVITFGAANLLTVVSHLMAKQR